MLEISNVSHSFGDTKVVHSVTLSLGQGEVGCLLGASGSGKTTLLRCIAGFEKPNAGKIKVDGETVADDAKNTAPENRQVAMVFQDYALLPHLSARQNVLFALHARRPDEAESIADEMLRKVGLQAFAARYPHELSGGQQQRVAIARALAPTPRLLLMDEPFSNVDATMRADLGQEIRELLLASNTTTLIATHDHDDAFTLGQSVGVMQDGQLVQWDSAYNVYHQPASRFVADFVGRGAWLEGEVVGDNEIRIEPGIVTGRMTQEFGIGERVALLLRPDDVVHDDDSKLQATVVERRFKGSAFIYEIALPSGQILYSLVPSHHDHAVGESIGIRFDTEV